MLRADALEAIYPELEHRIVVTIMGAVAAELYRLAIVTTFSISNTLWGLPHRWASGSLYPCLSTR